MKDLLGTRAVRKSGANMTVRTAPEAIKRIQERSAYLNALVREESIMRQQAEISLIAKFDAEVHGPDRTLFGVRNVEHSGPSPAGDRSSPARVRHW